MSIPFEKPLMINVVEFCLRAVFITMMLFAVSGCMSGSGDSGQGSGDTQQTGGGTGGTGGTGGGTGGTGGDTGGTGGGTGGTGGGTGGTGGSGGDTGGTTVYGSLANLYVASNKILHVVNCLNPSSGAKTFEQVVLRVIGQNGNFVDAAITLTPAPAAAYQFDQIFINFSGNFQPDGSFIGTISNAIYTLSGAVVVEVLGSIIINVSGTDISIDFFPDAANTSCGLSGGIVMSEDPGAGGGTGGGTGGTGGTGGGTGGTGGTGGATGGTDSSGTTVQASGQFGVLTFLSTDRPEDSDSYEMTNVILLTQSGREEFLWWNPDVQATLAVYFGFGEGQATNGQMVFNSVTGNDYVCLCFPTIDLINLAANFNNLLLYAGDNPSITMTVNGTVTFPSIN